MPEEPKKELLADNFPSNTKSVVKTTDGKEVKKVIAGTARQRKTSISRRLSGSLFEDNTSSVADYVVQDVLVPAAKEMIYEMISGGLGTLLFGSRRGNRTVREKGKSYVDYGSVSYRGATRGAPVHNQGRDISRVGRARHDFGEIVLETRGEAEEVLSALFDLVVEYKQATVSDLYDLVGIAGAFTDDRYGWTDLRGSSVSRVRNGWVLNLPKTELLD